MNIDITKTVCFTGHRPDKLGGYDDSNPLSLAVNEHLIEHIEHLIQIGFDTFISGMAQGTDQYAFDIVLLLKSKYPHIKLISAIPFNGQERMWKKESQGVYRHMMEDADDVVVVCDGGYKPYKMQKRNEFMVDHSSVVIAVWDGSKGGTCNCVKYARKQNKELLIINPINI